MLQTLPRIENGIRAWLELGLRVGHCYALRPDIYIRHYKLQCYNVLQLQVKLLPHFRSMLRGSVGSTLSEYGVHVQSDPRLKTPNC